MSGNRELVMLLVGDVFVVREDPPSVFRYVRDLLRGADFTFGNLEGSVADSGKPRPKTETAGSFKADARQITAVESAGFHAMTVANNHMMDCGQDALFETLGHLDRLGIAHSGGGRDFTEAHAPAIVEREGCRIAMLGYTSIFMNGWAAGPQSPGLAVMRAQTSYQPPPRFFEVPGSPATIHTWVVPADKAQLGADIAAARSRADIVVCAFHWGVSQGLKELADYQVELGHHAIDAGADLVFGHHPHAVQGVEVHQGRAIFYSLGNFTFARHKAAPGHELETMIVRCRIRDRRIKVVEFLPVLCDEQDNPHVLDLPEGRNVIELVTRRSIRFGTQFVASGDAMHVPTGVE
jgi:poly-gamma-glutamate capsule biosynthesis protein CapA/YwtB (metallophosphatase superfamily)